MIAEDDLDALLALARRACGHWQVADRVLECRTCGAYHLEVIDQEGSAHTVVSAGDVLDDDRDRLLYLAAAANVAPLLAEEVRRLRALLRQ
jgi:hypothetical protein